jgi:hypothetical protein
LHDEREDVREAVWPPELSFPMQAKLIVIGGKANRRALSLNVPVIVGRSRGVGLTIAHPMVSRQHCEIFETDGVLRLRDLGSTNGTFVSGKKVSEAVLRPHDKFSIGPLTFEVDYDYVGDATVVEEQYEDFTRGDARATSFAPQGNGASDKSPPEVGFVPVSDGESAEDAAFGFLASPPDSPAEPAPPPEPLAEPAAEAEPLVEEAPGAAVPDPSASDAGVPQQAEAPEAPVDVAPADEAMADDASVDEIPVDEVSVDHAPAAGAIAWEAPEPGPQFDVAPAAPEEAASGPSPVASLPSIAPPDGEIPDFSAWTVASAGQVAAVSPSETFAPPAFGPPDEFGQVSEYSAPEAVPAAEEVGYSPEPEPAWGATPDDGGPAAAEEPAAASPPSPWENPVDDEGTTISQPRSASAKPKPKKKGWWPFSKEKGLSANFGENRGWDGK